MIRSRQPLAVGNGSFSSTPINKSPINPLDNNKSKIYDSKFSHYTDHKKQEMLDQARKQLENRKREWAKDEQELLLSIADDMAARYAGTTYASIKDMFDNRYKSKQDLLKALIHFNIPYSEYIWSPNDLSNADQRKDQHSGEDTIDRRIAQFPTEQHILQAYRNYVDALKARDKGTGHDTNSEGAVNGMCTGCLSNTIRNRDKLLDAAKRIRYVKQHNQYSPAS